MKLSKRFGGQCENVYKLMPFSSVDDFLIKLVEWIVSGWIDYNNF